MFIAMVFALYLTPSHAAQAPCEVNYIKQCKAAVQGVRLQPNNTVNSPLIGEESVGNGLNAKFQEDVRPEASAWQEAHAQCTELLDACQTSCSDRVHKCKAGMTAPMHLAEQSARGDREPSSDARPQVPDAADRHAAIGADPAVLQFEF